MEKGKWSVLRQLENEVHCDNWKMECIVTIGNGAHCDNWKMKYLVMMGKLEGEDQERRCYKRKVAIQSDIICGGTSVSEMTGFIYISSSIVGFA